MGSHLAPITINARGLNSAGTRLWTGFSGNLPFGLGAAARGRRSSSLHQSSVDGGDTGAHFAWSALPRLWTAELDLHVAPLALDTFEHLHGFLDVRHFQDDVGFPSPRPARTVHVSDVDVRG
jgi:hypothetical protein